MPKDAPVRVIDRRFDDDGTAQGGVVTYSSPPTFTTGALLGASALNVLSDNMAWLQAHRTQRSAPQPMATAPNQEWEWRYMCVHQFDTLAISYTIGTDAVGSAPNFNLINSTYPSGAALSAYINGGGDFATTVGAHSYTCDLSSLGLVVGNRYRIVVTHDAAGDSTFELEYLYELDT